MNSIKNGKKASETFLLNDFISKQIEGISYFV
jgi:hypothetical protein